MAPLTHGFVDTEWCVEQDSLARDLARWLLKILLTYFLACAEPWPNAAHGCVVDYYGIPKHAFYTVKQALAMVDISLAYSDVKVQPGHILPATVWVDSELNTTLQCAVDVLYFTPAGKRLGTERIAAVPSTHGAAGSFAVPPAAATELRQLNYVPPTSLLGDVLIVRLTLMCAEDGPTSLEREVATNDFAFGIVAPPQPSPAPPKGCIVEIGFDWKPSLPGQKVVSANDAGDCCAACAAQPGCKAGTLFGKHCWLKDAAAAVTKYANPGVTSCQPSNRTAGSAATPLPPAGGPLNAFLTTVDTTLTLALQMLGTSGAPRVVLQVSAANTSNAPCALYVKPTLRGQVTDGTTAEFHTLGYVSFSAGFVTLLPGQVVTLELTSAGLEDAAEACVEAWNAPRVCVSLEPIDLTIKTADRD